MAESAQQRSLREEELFRAVNSGLDEARVLVVEDDEAMRTFLDESLREEGYVVQTASNTLSAIVTLLADRADVLVIDWKMPDLDGFALLSAVRRCFPELPVIFVTAFARPEIERRGPEEGGVSFPAQPLRPSRRVAESQGALEAPTAAGGRRGDP